MNKETDEQATVVTLFGGLFPTISSMLIAFSVILAYIASACIHQWIAVLTYCCAAFEFMGGFALICMSIWRDR